MPTLMDATSSSGQRREQLMGRRRYARNVLNVRGVEAVLAGRLGGKGRRIGTTRSIVLLTRSSLLPLREVLGRGEVRLMVVKLCYFK